MKRVLIILLIVIPLSAKSTDYFVKATGSDSNTGLSDAQAWQTLSKVQSSSFSAGDNIWFNRGDTFRGSLYKTMNGSSSNWITLGAYGTGAKPLILGAKDISATGDWEVHSGNIWKTTATLGTNQNDISNLIFNNEESCGFKENSLDSLNVQGKFFYNTSDNLLYLYSTQNPGTYYNHIEAAGHYDLNQGLFKWYSSSYIKVQNLDLRYSSAAGIEFGESNHFIVEYCDLSFIGGEWFSSATAVRLGNGISMINNVSNGIVRYNYIKECYDAGISPQGWTAGYVQSDIDQYKNTIVNCYYSYEGYGASTGNSMIRVDFNNNTCIDAGSCWSNTVDQRPDHVNSRHVMIWKEDGTHTDCNIKNNIFTGTCVTAIRINEDDSYPIKHDFDYNIYNVSAIASTYEGIWTTLLQWQTNEAQDLNSISGDPLFEELTEYSLNEESPCIDAGTDVGLEFSGSAPDIGVFEYGIYEADYYVATNGNDSNPGTFTEPWATWYYGVSQLVAGDTLYIRGGTYQPTGTFSDAGFGDSYNAVTIHNTNGTAENRIVVMGYPGERAILDGVNVTQGADTCGRHGIKMTYSDYWTFKNFEITGFVQLPDQLGVAPFQVQEHSDYNEFIELKIYDNGGSGIRIIYDCTGNLIYNCDSWGNYDHLSVPTPGNNSDGFEIADITDTNAVNIIRGCRGWDNSDDGIDLMRNEGLVIIDSCWMFYNGFTANYPATGFKLGQSNPAITAYSTKRILTNSIAAFNESVGIAANVSYQIMEVYNNLVYANKSHGVWWYIGSEGAPSVIRNNISFGNVNYEYSYIYESYIFDHNSYSQYDETGPVADASDFVTLDTLGLRFSRKSNGCLPNIQFGKLASTSDLIDAGVDVGIGYNGAAPDLGPFEYDPGAPVIPSGDGLFGKSRLGVQLKDKNGNPIRMQ